MSAALVVLLATLLGPPPSSGTIGVPVAPGATLAHPCIKVLERDGPGCQVGLLASLGPRGIQAFSLGTPVADRPTGDRVTTGAALDAHPELSVRPPATGAEPGPGPRHSEIHRVPATGRAARPPPIAP